MYRIVVFVLFLFIIKEGIVVGLLRIFNKYKIVIIIIMMIILILFF